MKSRSLLIYIYIYFYIYIKEQLKLEMNDTGTTHSLTYFVTHVGDEYVVKYVVKHLQIV